MLPEPALSFTIPSLHDGTNLDCRVFHPVSLAATNIEAPPWRRYAALMAHPYAPMGGCYDDPVLESVAATLLRTGYLVGTFNFRGAGQSAGRTSWTAKPERIDYASMVGFMVHYIHFLDPFAQNSTPGASTDEEASPADTQETPQSVPDTLPTGTPTLLMGGYSYGAMITAQIAPLGRLLEPFASPRADSNAAQIRLRAQHLAEQQNIILRSMRSAILQVRNPHGAARRSGSVRIGGDEGDRPSRKSHDSFFRRSLSLDTEDRFRRGVHDFMAKRKARHPHLHWPRHTRSASSDMTRKESLDAPAAEEAAGEKVNQNGDRAVDGEKLPVIMGLLRPRPAYLLVSPLQGLVTHLATMSLLPSRMRPQHDDAAEQKLVANATLAVFGDNDVFVSAGKLRTWMARLRDRQGSLFTGYEVASAGHFWEEDDVLRLMTERIGAFSAGLMDDGG
ncbi:hypothetical protein ED733_006740 [Metarhizium rileyi]|uniref:Prolyl oligopeptidase n=1 Tax=Metarhizium rileyi (strain RCEF 4871) TaxID=1649241 RepID=A0A5C6GMK3_METRR|nr:hypothetical protein ED733_006740 [Metarhizium rileyi]